MTFMDNHPEVSEGPDPRNNRLTDDEVEELVRALQERPGIYRVVSRHASFGAASSRVSEMRKSKRWGGRGLVIRTSRRILRNDAEAGEAAVIACWPESSPRPPVEIDWSKLDKAALIEAVKAARDGKVYRVPPWAVL